MGPVLIGSVLVVLLLGSAVAAGFLGYRRTERSFTDLFDRYRADRLIPDRTS